MEKRKIVVIWKFILHFSNIGLRRLLRGRPNLSSKSRIGHQYLNVEIEVGKGSSLLQSSTLKLLDIPLKT